MGERNSARKLVVQAVACQEAVESKGRPVDDAMRVQTPEGALVKS